MTSEVYNRSIGFWEDFRVNATTTRQGATSKPDFDYTNLALLFPQNDATEKIYVSDQMPHAWQARTEIKPHVHWIQESSDVAVWKLDYRFTSNGKTFDTGTTTIQTVSQVFPYPGSGSILQISRFPPIDMGKYELSTIFDFVLYRDDNVVTGDVKFKSFDFHYLSSFYGSTQEYPSYEYEGSYTTSRR